MNTSNDPGTVPVGDKTLRRLANCIRFLSMDAVQRAKSGHPGMPMGMADIATVLFSEFMKFDPEDPKWFDRDRFLISNGHGSMLLYSLLYLTGYEDVTIEEIKRFRQIDSKTPGHPVTRNIILRRGSRRRPARSAKGLPTRSDWRLPSGS